MLEWGGFPGDTGTLQNCLERLEVMNDWNVRNVSGVSGTTGMSGKTGMPGMSECLVRHTDGFLEDLLAFYA